MEASASSPSQQPPPSSLIPSSAKGAERWDSKLAVSLLADALNGTGDPSGVPPFTLGRRSTYCLSLPLSTDTALPQSSQLTPPPPPPPYSCSNHLLPVPGGCTGGGVVLVGSLFSASLQGGSWPQLLAPLVPTGSLPSSAFQLTQRVSKPAAGNTSSTHV